MRVLVCGGRDFDDYDLVCEILGTHPVGTTFAHGAARGADELAHRFAMRNGYSVYSYPADWRKHGKGAGPIRSQRMLDEFAPDLVIAFPGGRGTMDMVSRARKADVDVREIQPR
jgi:hypothetical protein